MAPDAEEVAAMATTREPMVELSEHECLRLLTTRRPRLGRLAFVDAGWPLVLPVNYVAVDRVLYFRTATGSKLFAALKVQQVTSRSTMSTTCGRRAGACWRSVVCAW